ncbi:MBL fold metallo-hydrolase [Xanthomonas sp. NCPPB 2632]|uniref:MBL fold metallo-hydrolase n=1 Tax=Xanthomonas sp. NCPPB 2632 TaxID=3240912 RepID=UPI003516A38E
MKGNADDLVYLKRGTKLNPVVNGWYAWTHLVSPLQRAMNIAFRHVPLMRSFVRNPDTHIAAMRDSSLYGGPFVELGTDDVPAVEALLEHTLTACAPLINLARDWKKLDEHLLANARGHSLNDFHANVPDSLGGLVEFFYDINSQPKLRVIEELLYADPVYNDNYQVVLSHAHEDERFFFMSTPLVPRPTDLVLDMRFDDPRIDLLSALRTHGKPYAEVVKALDIPESHLELLDTFLTTAGPGRENRPFDGEGARMRYFGHGCVLLESKHTSVLIDPMFAWNDGDDDGRYTYNDLPEHIDYVVISHNHQDHCAPEMLLQLRHRVGLFLVPANNSGSITDPSVRLMLNALGIANVRVMNAFDAVEINGGRITSLPFPGEHVDLDIYSRHGVHVELEGKAFGFLVDSDGWDPRLFARIARRMGRRIDALFIGMECHGAPLTWLYGPLLTKSITRRDDESRRLSGLDSKRSLKVVDEFDVGRVYVYAMGQEPWLKYIMGLQYTPDSIQLKEVASFLELCTGRGLHAENLYMSHSVEF